NPVATHDTSKDVDEDRLYLRILEDDPETGFNRRSIGRTPDVQEVGGFATAQLDHIHGRHGQTGPVDHTTYVPIQLDKIQIVLAGFDFRRIFLADIPQRLQVRMTHQGIVIEVHLTVDRDDLLVAGLEQRVDLEHRTIQPYICIIKIRNK